MINRAIIIFPEFSNIQILNEIRSKYDPLCNYIAPHITLVFPFKSNLTKKDLIEHLKEKLAGTNSFELIAKGVTGASDGYVFLDVKTGNDNIIELHDKLYKGILKNYHNKFIPYTPHITIGRLKDDDKHKEVVELLSDFDIEFRVVIDKINIEIIDDSEKSVLEYEYNF